MAFEISNKATTLPEEFVPHKRVELADQAATSAGQDVGFAAKVWRALIYQKAFTAGTGTRFVMYALEVADDAGFTTNVRSVATGVVQRADEQTLVLLGMTPFAAGQRFGRIKLVTDGTDAVTYDAILEAA